MLDDALEEVGLGELVEVDVADLDDAIAVEDGGELVDAEGAMNGIDLVPGDLAGVKGHDSGERTCTY